MSSRQLGHPQTRYQQGDSDQQTRYQLEYLADLVLELKTMAEKANTPTLAGLLELAHHEAQIQLQQRKQP